MLNIHHSFNLKVFAHIFLIINFILTLGFFNESWMSLLAWLTLFMLIYSGSISFNIKRWLFIISITIFSLSIKSFIKTPYILEGSNVFIGGDFENSIFKEKMPPIIFNHLNEDFKKN